MYEYRATLLRVVDGDTVHLAVDLGFDVTLNITGRLHGINTPEMNTEAGHAARGYLLDLIGPAEPGVWLGRLLVHTVKDRREKYGRYLVTLWRDGEDTDQAPSINQRLVGAGHAQPYSGGTRHG
jgi:micrococcal nuclease